MDPTRRAAGTDVVLNHKAGRIGGRHGGLGRVMGLAARNGGARVHETHSLDDLEDVAREIAMRGSDAIVLAGGDGSYMAGVSALVRTHGGRPLPPLGFAPGGTVCTVARNLGMGGRRYVWAERIVRAACEGTARVEPYPTLRVRDDLGGDRIGFIFGAGLVAHFFGAYYAAPRQGRLPAASLVARIFAGAFTQSAFAQRVLAPTACALTVHGETHATRRWSLVLASVVRDVGLHLRVPYRAAEELLRFHLVASGLPPRALARQLARALTGRPFHGEPLVDALTPTLRVEFDDVGAYVLDGDLFPARTVTIEAGPTIPLLRLD